MPRTRAAQRNAILEDLDDAAAVPLPSTPQRGDRAPLGEILLNEQEPAKVGLEVNQGKLEKGAQATKNKSAGHKKKTASKENARPESAAAVVEDDYESSTSSAVEEACQDLKDGSKYENFRAPYLDRRPQTPPSKAVRAARRKLSPKSETPRFNPEIHRTPESTTKPHIMEDSFVAAIGSRSPAKIANAEPIAEETQAEAMAESSVIEDTVAPKGVTEVSPGRSQRIEDSVEAIDALQDAIEQAGASFAAVGEDNTSPVEEKKAPSQKSSNAKPVASKAAPKPKANTSKPVAEKRSTAQKSPIPKAPVTKSTTARPVAAKKLPQTVAAKPAAVKKTSQSPPLKATKAATIKTTTPSTKPASKPFKARPSTTSNPPFIPAKSSKAPTRSTFTLPGEAISAKLKAQREERLKREEEENKAKREFKARPAPSGRVSSGSSATLPRPNASSKARASIAKGEKIELPKRTSVGPSAAQKRVSSTGAVIGMKTGTLRPSLATKGPSSSSRPSPTGTLPSRPANSPSNKTATTGVPATKTGSARGKAAYNRQREEQDKALKDKMAAAKKARADAAERGRLASREWAEKKKKGLEARNFSTEAKSAEGEERKENGSQEKEIAA